MQTWRYLSPMLLWSRLLHMLMQRSAIMSAPRSLCAAQLSELEQHITGYTALHLWIPQSDGTWTGLGQNVLNNGKTSTSLCEGQRNTNSLQLPLSAAGLGQTQVQAQCTLSPLHPLHPLHPASPEHLPAQSQKVRWFFRINRQKWDGTFWLNAVKPCNMWHNTMCQT